mmetsp:Transcript_70229/g.132488  ORF Transcript_70229/g.132488 Transcript_70229/m.132488 type:complete len:81 (+) Transcript_70229:217-459(+)
MTGQISIFSRLGSFSLGMYTLAGKQEASSALWLFELPSIQKVWSESCQGESWRGRKARTSIFSPRESFARGQPYVLAVSH